MCNNSNWLCHWINRQIARLQKFFKIGCKSKAPPTKLLLKQTIEDLSEKDVWAAGQMFDTVSVTNRSSKVR